MLFVDEEEFTVFQLFGNHISHKGLIFKIYKILQLI